MIYKPENDHDRGHDRDHDNDNGKGQAVVPAPSAGALAALQTLGTVLNRIDTAAVSGRSGLPMLQFKREGDGTWQFGQRRSIVEDGSRWGVNPLTFKWGWIAFANDNKVAGERLVHVSLPKPELAELPDCGSNWTEQWAVNLKCIDGTDAGTETIYKPTTVGGIGAIAGLIDAVRDRINSGQHGGKVAPVVQLKKDSYWRQPYGRVWTPLLAIVDWMPLDGPAPAPEPEPAPPPPVESPPRRRRVA